MIIFILFSVENSITLCCAVLVVSDVLYAQNFNLHFTNSLLSAVTLIYEDSSHPNSKSQLPFLFLRSFRRIFPSLTSCVTFCNILVLQSEELLHPLPSPQAGEPPFVGCPLLIQSYLSHLAAIFSNHDLQTGHVTVTQTHYHGQW